ncbi:MAG: inositol monophosphatase family protein [SAR324 cluster bacterium]|nr:inositol monophosphatase family protein [SAR324 cluster bacterium]
MQAFWDKVLSFSKSLSSEVAMDLLSDFGKVTGVEKEDGSLVTVADKRADSQIREAIQNGFPDHGLLTEEADSALFPGNDWCWVVDPLDGTNNFARGIPVWGISLALLYQGTPVFGYADFPPLQQSCYGFFPGHPDLKGSPGAFINGKAIHPRNDEVEPNQFFTFCTRSIRLVKERFPCKIRMLGSGVYEFVAVAGGVTLGAVSSTPKIWDIAGAYPIVLAAGAHWKSFGKHPFPLEVGRDYLQAPFPLMITARAELVNQFQNYFEAPAYSG